MNRVFFAMFDQLSFTDGLLFVGAMIVISLLSFSVVKARNRNK